MAKQIINIGRTTNDGSGDPLRSAFDKINNNFTELYNSVAGGSSFVTEGLTPPTDPADGQLWWNTDDGRLYIYYSSTWVDASPTQIDPDAIRFNGQNQIELPEGGDIVDFNGNSVLIKTSAAPAHSYGVAGDRLGTIAFDNNFFYYCKQDYVDDLTNIWVRVAWTETNW